MKSNGPKVVYGSTSQLRVENVLGITFILLTLPFAQIPYDRGLLDIFQRHEVRVLVRAQTSTALGFPNISGQLDCRLPVCVERSSTPGFADVLCQFESRLIVRVQMTSALHLVYITIRIKCQLLVYTQQSCTPCFVVVVHRLEFRLPSS